MSTWTLAPPTPSDLGDHDVDRVGSHLAGRRVALLVTGGIAAMKAPLVARALRRQGAQVVAFASPEALRYVTSETLAWSTVNPVVERLTAAAEHLSDSAPFDAYLVAPATYNSINKIAAGIADGVITATVASALGRMEQGRTAVLIAPTMHGSLHNRILVESLQRLHGLGVRIIPPRDAYGKHNLPDEPVLVAEVARAVSRSPLAGRRVLVTGGSPALPIDGVRRIVDRFRGRLGIAIATELHLRGAAVTLIHGGGAFPVPAVLHHRIARTQDDYRELVHTELRQRYAAAVFAASGCAYQLKPHGNGASVDETAERTLTLLPTSDVVEEVRGAHPDLYLVACRYRETSSHEQLMALARDELGRVPCVLATRGEEMSGPSHHLGWLVTRDGEPRQLVGKPAIAAAIADHLEQALGP
jgi:phosphopantothenoylcysteine decarboxylase/phosphopantothenate--cysteine ligase